MIIKKFLYIVFVIIGYIGFISFVIVLMVIFYDDSSNRPNQEYLGDGYTLCDEKPQRIYGPEIEIPPTILEYKYNGRYIIVIQNLHGKEPEYMFTEHNYTFSSLSDDNYWIIDKEKGEFFGPLSRMEYENKKDSLNIDLSFDSDNLHYKKLSSQPYVSDELSAL